MINKPLVAELITIKQYRNICSIIRFLHQKFMEAKILLEYLFTCISEAKTAAKPPI